MFLRRLHGPFALATALFFLMHAAQASTYTFTEGVDYKRLAKPVAADKGKIVQFFSYDCRYCFRAEPSVKAFLKQKPAHIKFELVPVTLGMFKREATSYAYFLALELGVQEKFHDYMYTIIHISLDDEKKTYNKLANVEDVRKFFVDHGVDGQKFDAALEKIKAAGLVQKADKKAGSYKVAGTPTFIFNGKYRADGYTGHIDAEKRFAELLIYLSGKP